MIFVSQQEVTTELVILLTKDGFKGRFKPPIGGELNHLGRVFEADSFNE